MIKALDKSTTTPSNGLELGKDKTSIVNSVNYPPPVNYGVIEFMPIIIVFSIYALILFNAPMNYEYLFIELSLMCFYQFHDYLFRLIEFKYLKSKQNINRLKFTRN